MTGRKKFGIFLIFITFLESLEQEEYSWQKKEKTCSEVVFLP